MENYMQKHFPKLKAFEILKYIGPGLLVTIGFIDPGNWASNIAAGARYGYTLLWMVTLSTVFLIVLQHNAAHLGIASGLCLSEAVTKYMRPSVSKTILGTAVLASISTALAEILGAAIALNMLFKVPIKIGAVMTVVFIIIMLFTNSYRYLERWLIGFVSLIGLAFLYEMSLIPVDWAQAGTGWIAPIAPHGSMPIIMSVLGAVVMPHNLFLHSEIIQSRQWNLSDEKVIRHQLDYELFDTLFSMVIGWIINSSMIIVAAATFFMAGTHVDDLAQAQAMLQPLVGGKAALIFALALLFAGVASSVTASMAGGTIVAGIFSEPYDLKDNHSRIGVGITLAGALCIIFFLKDTFQGLLLSQMFLSIQLPITVCAQIYLTSSRSVMGKFANSRINKIALGTVAVIVFALNIMLLLSYM